MEWLSSKQPATINADQCRAFLQAAAEALWPTVPAQPDSSEARAEMFAFSAKQLSKQRMDQIVEAMNNYLNEQSRKDMIMLMSALNTTLGTLLLGGLATGSLTRAWGGPFHALPLHQRAAILRAWSLSPLPPLRKAFKGLRSYILASLFAGHEPDGSNPIWSAIGYPGPTGPPAQPLAPSAMASEQELLRALTDMQQLLCSTTAGAAVDATGSSRQQQLLEQLRKRGLAASAPTAADAAAAGLPLPQLDAVVECDVVVVGSGAGGGVAAERFASAGLRVVVVEKSSYRRLEDMAEQWEEESFEAMYESAGFLTTVDGGVSILAGSTVGGGTKVNWCASIRPPPCVRQEWAAAPHGLTDVAGPEFDAALDAVCERLGVNSRVAHNGQNGALLCGLQRLGAASQAYPRNCGAASCSGYCSMGCRWGHKASSDLTFLADACRKGAKLLTRCWAERVVTTAANSGATTARGPQAPPEGAGAEAAAAAAPRPKRAVGVLVRVSSQTTVCSGGQGAAAASSCCALLIKAPTVVSSAGALHTPALLLRSGITCNGNVGSNLRLHPATVVVGIFPSGQGHKPAAAATAAAAGAGADGGDDALADPEDPHLSCCSHANGHGGSSNGHSDAGASAGDGCSKAAASTAIVPTAGAGAPLAGCAGAIRMWDGAIMSVLSAEAADWDGSGYGPVLSVPIAHPGTLGAFFPWAGAEQYKTDIARIPDAAMFLVFCRDKGSGRVTLDPATRGPALHYWPSAFDQASLVKGISLAIRAAVAAGAQEVLTLHNGLYRYVVPQQYTDEPADAAAGPFVHPPGLDEFLATVAALGVAKYSLPVFSAHQMGSARLGCSPDSSVADTQGECWEVAGLHIADASAFPTCSGVNPMVTTEALAYLLCGRAAQRLAAAKRGSGGVDRGRYRKVKVAYEDGGE